jgi:glycolate oxidase
MAKELIEKQAARIHDLIKPLGLVQFRAAKDNAESEALWKVRRLVSPSLRDVNPHKYNEDIVVPRSKVPVVIRQIERSSRSMTFRSSTSAMPETAISMSM